MKTELRTDITVGDIIKGFVYNELEGKGLFGLDGKLVIQPEYQRNYLYSAKGKEVPVIMSVLNGYPLGILYFNTRPDGKYEVLDGQQRITSLGRFITGKFAIEINGTPWYFDSLSEDNKKKILEAPLLIYICSGTESEIKEWFKTINIAGIPLNDQELRNAVYSGPFITLAKKEFSNTGNAEVQKRSSYLSGEVNRQDYLETALKWVSKDNIDTYMASHRNDNSIVELKRYFDSVIDWINSVFPDLYKEMKGLEWGKLYETYHNNSYGSETADKVSKLMNDPSITNRKGIFEYILGRCKNTKLLNIRIFDARIKQAVYNRQTAEAKAKGISNCPLCAASLNANRIRIYKINEMDADHVSAWSKGGESTEENCEMLCKTHNEAKGNR